MAVGQSHNASAPSALPNQVFLTDSVFKVIEYLYINISRKKIYPKKYILYHVNYGIDVVVVVAPWSGKVIVIKFSGNTVWSIQNIKIYFSVLFSWECFKICQQFWLKPKFLKKTIENFSVKKSGKNNFLFIKFVLKILKKYLKNIPKNIVFLFHLIFYNVYFFKIFFEDLDFRRFPLWIFM